MYPHDGHSPTNPDHPEEIGYCDRCSRRWYLRDLRWQTQYIGPSLQSLHLRVCPDDLDDPSPFLKPVRIQGPEGVVKDARPFQTAGGYNSVGPSAPILPNFPLAEAIEGDEVPPSAPVLTT
ncbi:MAG: hypothetical protein KGL39_55170 [Patescibacteria group bacterium]|nr:hypothetical protein [Patescibacteria group bacterium]